MSKSLQQKIVNSILNMGIQRALDFVSVFVVTTFVVRSLSRDEYGMLSVVLSYGLIFNLLNISVSTVLLRDYQALKGHIGDYMRAFILFSLCKCTLVFLLSLGIGFFLFNRYHSLAMIMVLAINALSTGLLYLSEPFMVLLSVDFRQSVLTKINLVSSLTNVILTCWVFMWPTALYVSAKNAVVALVILVLTAWYSEKVVCHLTASSDSTWLQLVKESFIGFSLWSYLMGVLTDFVYRADLLILGWVGAPLRTVGNYNISLQMANFTKLLPQILQYNATLGLSHSKDTERKEELTFLFVKYSFLLSLATMIGYVLFGRLAIQIISGRDVDEIFRLGFYIVGGICVFNTVRPLVSYCTVVHSIRECLLFAIAPPCIITLIGYGIMGTLHGAFGLALVNLLSGIVMAFFVVLFVHRQTDFRWHFKLLTESEVDLFSGLYAKLRRKPFTPRDEE